MKVYLKCEQICTAFITCKMPCDQFLNTFISYFYEGGRKLENSLFIILDNVKRHFIVTLKSAFKRKTQRDGKLEKKSCLFLNGAPDVLRLLKRFRLRNYWRCELLWNLNCDVVVVLRTLLFRFFFLFALRIFFPVFFILFL